ncbi:ATP-binding cassette domain-containing protein [Actinoplanes sp. NPDC049265]|uniref:ATP-binding cassette domain-containing protein n=1 Tax=Actinoplanes sp. NPDC049265 TaxID=3363902 RepID=UPI0037230973
MEGTLKTADNPAVTAAALRLRTGGHLAVRGIDLHLGAGVHGLLGPNGAGKTTLIRALATVLRPAGGTLTLLGHSTGTGRASAWPAARQLRTVRAALGYLPQDFGYYPRFTVDEFVEYMAWLKGVPRAGRRRAVRSAIERVGLAERARSRMKALSGGMLRRAGIAQAIVNEPDLLLLDEPTVGLDPQQRLDFRALLRELGERSCVVVSTHLVEDVAAACSNVLVIDAGTSVFQGTPAAVAAAGRPDDPGDSPMERGFSALVARHRGDAVTVR